MRKNTLHPYSSMPSQLWLALGGACIIAAAVTLLTILSISRSQSRVTILLAEKGASLIRAFEGGVRSGMRSQAGLRLQFLLEEMSDRQDIVFVAVTMPDGTILAHSDPKRIGEILMVDGHEISEAQLAALNFGNDMQWKSINMEGHPSFVVYRHFMPKPPSHKNSLHRDDQLSPPPPSLQPIIFLGLDNTPLVATQQQVRDSALFMGFLAFMLGLSGLALLIWIFYARASQRMLKAAEALVRQMGLSISDGLLIFLPNGKITYCNAALARLLNISEENPMPRTVQQALPPNLRPLVQNTIQKGRLPSLEIDCVTGSGVHTLQVRGGSADDGHGDRLYFLLLNDLSDLRRLEQEIRRREKLAAIGSLAAGVAHEIRNPLSSIKGYATYFASRFDAQSEDRKSALVMVQEVDRLNRVITDLIAITRPTEIQAHPTPLAGAIEHAVRLIRQDATQRGIEIRQEAEENLPLALLDQDRFIQAFLNVCLNAIDAMPEGGILTIRTGLANKEYLFLEVQDTGAGIAPENLPHIFDPYFTTKSRGTGLGLAITHMVIEAHGGALSVHSEPQKGSVFRFLLPIVK